MTDFGPRALLGAGLGIASVVALAQTTPGAVGDTLKPAPQLQRPAPTPIQKAPSAPATGQAPAGGKQVPVQQFVFTGNKIFDNEQLRAVVKSYEGRPLTLAEIYAAADAVGAFYASKGYTLASVNVPPQKVDNGVVRLEVSEGIVGKISVEGNQRYRTDTINAYLGGLRTGNVYRGTDLSRQLSILNDLPGLKTKAVLKPGEDLGTTEVVVQTKEDPFYGVTTVDNYGREAIGEFRFTAAGTLNNPLEFGDQLQLMGLISEHGLLKYGFGAYSVPLNHAGTRLTGSYGYADFRIRNSAGIDGTNETGRLELSHTFIRSQSDRVGVTVGVSHTEADADLSGIKLPGDTKLTLLEVGTTFLHLWEKNAATQIGLSASSNFSGTNYDELQDRGRDDHEKFRGQLDVLHLQPLAYRLELLLRTTGVWSPEILPDTDQFSLGGPSSVRGYPASEVRGDRGVFGSLTLRRPLMLAPVTLYGSIFADGGKVRRLDIPGDDRKTDSLSSAGIGFDFKYRMISARIEGAAPLDNRRTISDGHDDFRVFGSISASF